MRFKALIPLSLATPLAASVVAFYPISYNNSQAIGNSSDVQITNEVLDQQNRSFTLGDVVVNWQDNLIGEVFGGNAYGQDGYVEWTPVATDFNPPEYTDQKVTWTPGTIPCDDCYPTRVASTPEPNFFGFLLLAFLVMYIVGPKRSKGE